MDISKLFAENKKAKQLLHDMVDKGRISHAVLLTGPRGAGKKTFARIMASAFLCTGDNCFECNSCRKALSGIHPDVSEVLGYTKPRSFPVDEVRRIRREAYISPNEGKYRIFILANAESMGVEAQNSLLKIIEEPPRDTLFILTAQDTGALLPTVLSRVVTVPISAVSGQTVRTFAENKYPGADADRVELACTLAQGSIGRAFEIIEDDALYRAAQTATDIVKSTAAGNRYETLKILTAASQSDKLGEILNFTAALLEDAMCQSDTSAQDIASGLSLKRTVRMLEAVIFSKKALAFNANKPLLMTRLCVKMYE